MAIDYDGRVFGSVSNSATGEVGSATRFYYHQQGALVWADYSGGSIARGALLATVDDQGCLDMRYQHVNVRGDLMTGTCRSTPQVLPDGRYRLHEKWTWTCGDHASGDSVIEELAVEWL